MIKTIKCNKVKPTIYDLKVRIMVDGIATNSDGYKEFKRQFELKIGEIQLLNGYSPKQAYVIVDKEFYLQVWHKNTKGEHDRLIIEVFDIAYQQS